MTFLGMPDSVIINLCQYLTDLAMGNLRTTSRHIKTTTSELAAIRREIQDDRDHEDYLEGLQHQGSPEARSE
jgi:hypothetical protein